MHIDGRSLNKDSVETCDVCIVGSGPAGYAVARSLEGSGLKVIILESGGPNSVTGPHNLSMLGSDSSAFASDFHPSRRQIGGNASAWYIQAGGGRRWLRLATLTRADFDGVAAGDAGVWPLAFDEYQRWLSRAFEVFGLVPPKAGATPPEDAGSTLNIAGEDTRLFRFGDADQLLENMRSLYDQSPDIRLISNAYATEITPDESGREIRAVVFASEPGRAHRVEARFFVLAGGGLAIPQLMLASRSVVPEGIGNQNDTVGRWLMDHPLIAGGDIYPSDPELFRSASVYDLHYNDGGPYMGFLAPSDAFQRETRQISMGSMLFAREAGWKVHAETERQKRGVGGALNIFAALRARRLPRISDIFDTLLGIDGVVRKVLERYDSNAPPSLTRGGWSKATASRFERFEVLQMVEQRPQRENRVTLSDDVDPFGVPKAKLDWHWTDEDALAVTNAQKDFAARLAASGLGRYEIRSKDGKPIVYSASARHFMGSTRMSADPKQGVVDSDCRVHGLANLFIASSSLFPTGGYANPTLSIVAFGLRLGEHLCQLLQVL